MPETSERVVTPESLRVFIAQATVARAMFDRALAPLGGLGGDAISRTLDIIHDFRRAASVSPLLDMLRPAN